MGDLLEALGRVLCVFIDIYLLNCCAHGYL